MSKAFMLRRAARNLERWRLVFICPGDLCEQEVLQVRKWSPSHSLRRKLLRRVVWRIRQEALHE